MRSRLPILLGVDVGTTRVKAIGVALEGRELAHVDQPTPWVKDGVNVEMDPEELAHMIRTVVAEIAGTAAVDWNSGVRVVGIGVTGMAEAGVLVDRRGAPLNRIVGTTRAATPRQSGTRSALNRSREPWACRSAHSRRLRRSSGSGA